MNYRKSILQSPYLYLLGSLLLFFIINPFLMEDHVSNLIILVLFSLIIFLSVYVAAHNLHVTMLTFILAIFSALSYYYLIKIDANMMAYLFHFIINIVFLSIITSTVIICVTQQKQINADTLLGAVCGYLLIGFTWSFIYLTIITIDPASFSIHLNQDSARSRIDHFVYYSFVTLTTTGYGDILATKSVARTFSWLEAAVGQIYLAVWIAQLVGLRIVEQQENNRN